MNIISIATKAMQDAIKSGVDATKTVVDGIKTKTDTLDSRTNTINTNLNTVKSDTTAIKTNTQNILNQLSSGTDFHSYTPSMINNRLTFSSASALQVFTLASVSGRGLVIGGKVTVHSSYFGVILEIDGIDYPFFALDTANTSDATAYQILASGGDSYGSYTNLHPYIVNLPSIIPFKTSFKIKIKNNRNAGLSNLTFLTQGMVLLG